MGRLTTQQKATHGIPELQNSDGATYTCTQNMSFVSSSLLCTTVLVALLPECIEVGFIGTGGGTTVFEGGRFRDALKGSGGGTKKLMQRSLSSARVVEGSAFDGVDDV
jgi:hypothetical protein